MIPLQKVVVFVKLALGMRNGFCVTLVAMASFASAQQTAQEITDIQGRSLMAVVLDVDEHKVTARRANDGLEFTIPLESLSDATKESLRDFKKAEPTPAATEVQTLKSSAEISISDEMLTSFKDRLETLRKTIPDPKDEKSKFIYQQHASLHDLERTLILAASPKDPAGPIDWHDSINQRTRTQVEQLRQKIRDAERELLTAESEVDSNTTQRSSRSRRRSNAQTNASPRDYRDHEQLQQLYDRATKSLRGTLIQARKAIARESKAANPRESLLTTHEEKAKAAEEAINSIHLAFYGYKPGHGLDLEPGWPENHEAEILRKEIHTLRMAVLDKLQATANHSGEDEYRVAEIGGIEVYSSNFGVILDVSGSMRSHIDPLKKEIEESFQSPLYREINGCSLQMPSTSGQWAMAHNTLSAIEEMIIVHRVDTIYWFCDLRDTREANAIQRLRELLRMSGVKFYVRSVGLKPDAQLENLIHDF